MMTMLTYGLHAQLTVPKRDIQPVDSLNRTSSTALPATVIKNGYVQLSRADGHYYHTDLERYLIDTLHIGVTPGDSVFTLNIDSLCFISTPGPDTICVNIDSVYFSMDEVCYTYLGDETCYPWNSTIANIYTTNGLQQDPLRIYEMLPSYQFMFRQQQFGGGPFAYPFVINPDGDPDFVWMAQNTVSQTGSTLMLKNDGSGNVIQHFKSVGTNEDYAMGSDKVANCFTIAKGPDLGADAGVPLTRYFGSDSLVFYKDIKLRAGLRDKDGDLGTSGQVLSSTGTLTNWISASTFLDGNGMWTAANSNTSIVHDFTAIVDDSLQFKGNFGSFKQLYINLHAPHASGTANLFFTNNDTGSGITKGFLIGLTSSENGILRNRGTTDLELGTNNATSLILYGSQGGAIYHPSITATAPLICKDGFYNSKNAYVTTSMTLTRDMNFVNVTAGNVTDTIFLPEVITNSPASGVSIESATSTQTGVGQEYTITNRRLGPNLVIAAYTPVGPDDFIDEHRTIILLPGESAIIKCSEYTSGSGYWYSYHRQGKQMGTSVPAANDLTLANDGTIFIITGATTINAITKTNWQAGSEITLLFTGAPLVKNNTAGGTGTAVMKLAGGADFLASADDVLKLVYNGTSWLECSRSAN